MAISDQLLVFSCFISVLHQDILKYRTFYAFFTVPKVLIRINSLFQQD